MAHLEQGLLGSKTMATQSHLHRLYFSPLRLRMEASHDGVDRVVLPEGKTTW